MNRTLSTVAVALLLVVAGCAGAGGGDAGGPQSYEASKERSSGAAGDGASADASGGDGPNAETTGGAADAEGGGATAPAIQNRELIRTAELTVRVERFDRARSRLAAYARSTGGFVGDSRREVRGSGNETWVVGTVVLRIPVSNYSGALAVVDETGEVRASNQQTRDVTDQVVDLEARLENLRAERDRLRELYRQANDTESVLAVQQELSRVQQDIERTEAQLRQLERKVAFTTITVDLAEPRPDDPGPDRQAWYETGVVAAFLQSVDGVIVALRAGVVLTAYALPYLLVAAVPLGGGLVAVRRYRRRRARTRVETTEPVAPSSEAPDGDERQSDGDDQSSEAGDETGADDATDDDAS